MRMSRQRSVAPPAGTGAWVAIAILALVAAGCAPRRPTNLLIVTIDTLRADRLGAYGYGLAHTPHLDRLATEGVTFLDAVSAAPITLPSHSTIFTGLFPPAHGVRDNGSYALGPEATTLAEVLQRRGFRTQAFVPALVLARRYGLDQGFDGYDDDLYAEDQPAMFLIRDRPAATTATLAEKWLATWNAESPRKPFFLWVHLFDPHQPYTPPRRFRTITANPYDAEIAAADDGVGTILEKLRALGELDRTLVIVTADHGESLGEHGEKTHGIFIYDATVRVPLLVRFPALFSPGTRNALPVRSADLFPSALDALGLPAPADLDGSSFLPELGGSARASRAESGPPARPQYSESLLSEAGFGMAPLFGVRTGGKKLIRAPRPELYALDSDPRELDNLFTAQSRDAAQLDRRLTDLLTTSTRKALPATANPMDRETEEMLAALGYLAPQSERTAQRGIDPKDGLPLHNLLEDARHFCQQEKWNEARAKLEELLRLSPENSSAEATLAMVFTRLLDLESARDHYLRSLALFPQQSRIYVALGRLDLVEGLLEAAEKNFHRALEQTPGFVEAISYLGLVAEMRGDPPAAERRYREAIAVDPNFPTTYRRIADGLYERGEWRRALDYYEQAIARGPTDSNAWLQAGNCARRLGDPEGAAKRFRRAEALRPKDWAGAYNLACLAAQAGDIEGAWRELARAIQVGKLARRPIEADPDLAPLRARLDWETRLNDLIPRRTLETPDSGEDRNDEL